MVNPDVCQISWKNFHLSPRFYILYRKHSLVVCATTWEWKDIDVPGNCTGGTEILSFVPASPFLRPLAKQPRNDAPVKGINLSACPFVFGLLEKKKKSVLSKVYANIQGIFILANSFTPHPSLKKPSLASLSRSWGRAAWPSPRYMPRFFLLSIAKEVFAIFQNVTLTGITKRQSPK